MESNTYIAAIGASAGGLRAIKSFFSIVRPGLPVAYVVILHSQRTAKSLLAQIISRVTDVSVEEIDNGTVIRPDRIYVHPPWAKVLIDDDGKFKLVERSDSEKINRTIDYFFESAAKKLKDKVIGIIMSGTGSDGTKGFHAIEDNGGITITQDPNTAEFDGMPLSSIQFDHPTYVLSPRDIAFTVAHIASTQLTTRR